MGDPLTRAPVAPRPQGNHIFTSGATGTNAAVIRGALRAENPDLLTVVLPQSMSKQPAESQELLGQVQNVVEMPQNDELQLLEASRCAHLAGDGGQAAAGGRRRRHFCLGPSLPEGDARHCRLLPSPAAHSAARPALHAGYATRTSSGA